MSGKHYIVCGLEFGLDNVGKIALIVRELYDRKDAGRDFWHHMRSCKEFLGFKPQGGEPDVWMSTSTQRDGSLVYEYVLL